MDYAFYNDLTQHSLKGELFPAQHYRNLLTSPDVQLLPLLSAAFEVRRKFKGIEVELHIINNAQNGYCPEDCHYCAQAKSSQADIAEYPLKGDDEILAEARNAYESGAFRYCMVFAGRGPSLTRVNKLAQLIKDIKSKYPIEICVSCGLLDEPKAQILKEAGLDRLNHNLNTVERIYPEICTTHTYQDRLNTLNAATKAGLTLCSGMIAGMGETSDDIVAVALKLRQLQVASIPINFLVPIAGNVLNDVQNLNPQYCLKILCVFRLINPTAEIRVAAGREGHLRSLEVLSLYPANSIFLDGYLNTKGSNKLKTLRMIFDAGFSIRSDKNLESLLEHYESNRSQFALEEADSIMKDIRLLRPMLSTQKNSLPGA